MQSFQSLSSQPTVFLANPVPVQESRWKIKEDTIVNGVMPLVKQVADELQLAIVDFHGAVPAEAQYFKDGIHPNAAGAQRMAACAAAAVRASGKDVVLGLD